MSTLFTPFVDVTLNADWQDWQNYPNGRPNPLYSAEAGVWNVDGLILAFITLSADKTACWAAQPSMPLDWALPLACDLRKMNKDVIVSFGGAANSDISCGFTVEQLVSTYSQTIELYGAKGLDFDLENGYYNAANICTALKSVLTTYPGTRISFTLPVMPTGLVTEGLDVVQKAIDSGFDFTVNGMAMDYYNAEDDADMGAAAINAADSINDQLKTAYKDQSTDRYNQVAITPMIGQNDDPDGMFGFDDAVALAQYGKSKGFGFVSMWSFNDDNPISSDGMPNSGNPEQDTRGEYSVTFVNTPAQQVNSFQSNYFTNKCSQKKRLLPQSSDSASGCGCNNGKQLPLQSGAQSDASTDGCDSGTQVFPRARYSVGKRRRVVGRCRPVRQVIGCR